MHTSLIRAVSTIKLNTPSADEVLEGNTPRGTYLTPGLGADF